jgi:hypothetical protein
MICDFCAEDQHWAAGLLHDSSSYGAKRDSAPTGHAVRGDDDHVDVVMLCNQQQFHADVVGGADSRAHVQFFVCQSGSEFREPL